MSIRIWTARAHRLFPAVVQAMGSHLSGDECALLLVPEQFTLAAERELMRRLHLEGMFQLDVLSPSRLYEHVLNAAGRDEREPLSDAGRRMAVSQALEKLEDKLPYYGSITQRRGFVEKLCALITDMKRGGMTAESLAEYASALPDGVEKVKLDDLSRIYEQYHSVLADWVNGAQVHGATYLSSPASISAGGGTVSFSPASLLGINFEQTLLAYSADDSAVSVYRAGKMQETVDRMDKVLSSDLHIILSHEPLLYDSVSNFLSSSDSSVQAWIRSADLLTAGGTCGGLWRLPGCGQEGGADYRRPQGVHNA